MKFYSNVWYNICAFAFLVANPAIHAESNSLRERLAHRLPDIEQVDQIVDAYTTFSNKVALDSSTTASLEDWLLAKSTYIGSKNYDHNLFFRRAPSLNDDKYFNKHFKIFVDKITKETKEEEVNQQTNNQELNSGDLPIEKRITLLFTGAYGGGHRAPTMAIKEYLEKTGHTVQLIDVDDVENKYSPEINGYTKADIYAEVYQKQNNPRKAKYLTRLLNKAQPVEDKRFLTDIRHSVSEFMPQHIIAVAHHKPKLTYISYKLGIPMTYIHTDHGFNRMLLPVLYEQEKIENPLVRFALLGNDPLFQASESITKQLTRVDFPVRASFRPASRKRKQLLRKDLKIPKNAYVIKLAMGQNGLAKDMKKILNRIRRERKKLKKPLYVFAICGKNELLKKQLHKYTKTKGKVKVRVLGFLEEKQMAAVDRASDIWITKPGGSTSAELVQTRKQMLYEINPAHPWETNNAKHLEGLHLAKKLSSKKSIIRQIQSRIKVDKKLKKDKIPASNWQAQIDALIAE